MFCDIHEFDANGGGEVDKDDVEGDSNALGAIGVDETGIRVSARRELRMRGLASDLDSDLDNFEWKGLNSDKTGGADVARLSLRGRRETPVGAS